MDVELLYSLVVWQRSRILVLSLILICFAVSHADSDWRHRDLNPNISFSNDRIFRLLDELIATRSLYWLGTRSQQFDAHGRQ